MPSFIGAPIDRKDGFAKVTGGATYAAEHRIENLVHAVIVQSTIPTGRLLSIDIARARKSEGVLEILTHRNAERLNDPGGYEGGGEPGEQRQPLQDDQIHYNGQHIAVVIADSLEHASHAVSLVTAKYTVEPHLLLIEDGLDRAFRPDTFFGSKELQIKRGDPITSATVAAHRIEATYSTPVITHNPIEPHATVASWSGDELTLYETTQWVLGLRSVVSKSFNLPPEKVHVVSPFVGGAFGCKGFTWPHTLLAAMASRLVSKPVKLVLTRQQMFSSVGRRSRTIQHMSLACDATGRLQTLKHATQTETSPIGHYMEPCGSLTSVLYACPNVEITHEVVRLNLGTPTATRAPGEATGSFALESAMDEMALSTGLDPIELRIRNHADTDPQTGKPFSGKNLLECYRRGAEIFGWSKRSPQPQSMRQGNLLMGWGFATASYPANRRPAAATVTIRADGSAVVSTAAHDLGTGTYTTLAQIAADVLQLDASRVSCEIGDSKLPMAPVAGGSSTTASVGSAVYEAALDAQTKLRALGAVPDTYAEAIQRAGLTQIKGEAKLNPAGTDAHAPTRPIVQKNGKPDEPFSLHSFGAQFVEVIVDADLRTIRVSRVVSVHDVGRIANHKTAASQIRGGVVWGVGMALLEQTLVDERTGRVLNSNLADYLVPVHSDVPEIHVELMDQPDNHINALGMRGLGEIGIVGVAAAIANAVHHATGKRVRDLPITIDKLI